MDYKVGQKVIYVGKSLSRWQAGKMVTITRIMYGWIFLEDNTYSSVVSEKEIAPPNTFFKRLYCIK